MSAAHVLDCRGMPLARAGGAIVACYNERAAGADFEVMLDTLPDGLRVWLLEAGARYVARQQSDASCVLSVRRGRMPAQGSICGVHHVVSNGDSVWTGERGASAARIDAATHHVAARATFAHKASHLALGPGAKRLFVADSEADEVVALRAADLRVEARWCAPGGPQLPVASAEGIVCVTGPATGTLTIARPHGGGYAAQTLAVGGCPHDPLLSIDQQHVYVPCAGAGTVVKVRLADGVIAGRCAAGDGPSHLAAHPDGTHIYCANSWDGTLSCMSVDGIRLAQAVSGGWAHAIDIAPDGRWIYVANFFDDTLAVFDAATLERVALLPTDPYPHGLDAAPDGCYVLVAGFGGDCVRVFDAAAHCELARITVGAGASHSAFAAGSAFIACSVAGHVAALDLERRRVSAKISIH